MKAILLNKKKIYLAVALLSSALLLLMFSATRTKHSSNSKDDKLYALTQDSKYQETSLCDGFDWNNLSTFEIGNNEEQFLKSTLLKIAIESSALSAKPVIEGNAAIMQYVAYLNKFYQDPTNSKIPLFFALKIADMAKNKSAPREIEIYKLAVLQKLKSIGLVK